MSRRTAALLAGACALAGASVPLLDPHVALANDNCAQASSGSTNGTGWTCTWTQLFNPWPGDPGQPLNPPQCSSACYVWALQANGKPGDVPAAIAVSDTSNVKFGTDLKAAMQDWAGQPYKSPWVYICTNCSSSQIEIQMNAGSVSDANWCGQTTVDNHDQNNLLIHVTVTLNTSAPWYDGPPPAGRSGCDAKATAYHELGHAIGSLGHSGVQGNAMYWQGGAEAIGGDDQQGLNALYGPYNGTNNGGSGSCSNCQTICGQADNPCQPTPGVDYEGYLEKAWDMSQGVPMPNPVGYLSSVDGCLTYVFAKQYLNWFDCQVGIDG